MKLNLTKLIRNDRIYDISKVLQFAYPNVSTKRICQLILNRDSVDQAIIILQGAKEMKMNIDEFVKLYLSHKK